MNTKLVLLIVSLPPNPSSLRVRVWRRLRAIGAVALKRTVYLPVENLRIFHPHILLSADLADHIAPQRSAQSPSGHAVRALYARARRETFSSRRSRDLSLRYSAAPSL